MPLSCCCTNPQHWKRRLQRIQESASGRSLTELQHRTMTGMQHTRNPKPRTTLSSQQRTCGATPSEQSYAPNRCGCKQLTRHAELSRRPCPCRTVVQIHSCRQPACNEFERDIYRRASIDKILHHSRALNTHATKTRAPYPSASTH